MNIAEVIHHLIDANEGTGLDKEAAHAAVDAAYAAPEASLPEPVAPEPEVSEAPAVSDGIPPVQPAEVSPETPSSEPAP